MTVKAGTKSTEFWALLGVGALILANGFQAITIPWEQIQWYGGVVAAYIAGRSWTKGKAAAAGGTPGNTPGSTPGSTNVPAVPT